MKLHLFLPLTIAVSVALVALMRIRKREHEKEDKRSMFSDIKLRVTYDVLGEYKSEIKEVKKLLENTQAQHKALEEEVTAIRIKSVKSRGDMDLCKGNKKTAADDLANEQVELKNLRVAIEKEKAAWKTEMEKQKRLLASKSPVCNFLKKDSDTASKLCTAQAIVGPPKIEAVAPKPVVPKAEVPNPVQPEAPKPVEPKAEVPNPVQPKAEVPNPVQPKAEVPNPVQPKAEFPKPVEPKAEAPKPAEPNAEASKPVEPMAEVPKQDAKVEVPIKDTIL